MNYKVLKDIKAMTGFISSFILSLIAIGFAINNSSIWLFFVVASTIVLYVSAHRADKIME